LPALTKERAKPFPSVAPVTLNGPDVATTLWPRTPPAQRVTPDATPRRRGIDVGEVINRALTAAGLMKK
jgi:feruloyl esterase